MWKRVATGREVILCASACAIVGWSDTIRCLEKDGTKTLDTSMDKKLRLKQVQIAFRHGARTPYRDIDSHPRTKWHQHEVDAKQSLGLASIRVTRVKEDTQEVVGDPLSEEEIRTIDHKHHPEALHGGAIPARLTKVGMEQAIVLGEELRVRYMEQVQLLPERWDAAKEWIYVRSTETERTIETAQGVMTGLFPSQIAANNPADIFLKAKDEKEWGVANFGKWCPRLTQLFRQGAEKLQSPATKEAQQLLEELEEHVKLSVPETAGAFTLSMYRDQLACRAAHGKDLPQGSDRIEDVMERLNKIDAERIFKIFSGGSEESQQESTRLHAGRMLHRMLQSIEHHTEDSHKLLLYSGHDWTIIMLLLCLDPYGQNPKTRVWPKFCSDLSVELWEDSESGEEYVRVLLDGEPLELPYLGKPVSHSAFGRCLYRYRVFKQVLHHFTLTDDDIPEHCLPK